MYILETNYRNRQFELTCSIGVSNANATAFPIVLGVRKVIIMIYHGRAFPDSNREHNRSFIFSFD